MGADMILEYVIFRPGMYLPQTAEKMIAFLTKMKFNEDEWDEFADRAGLINDVTISDVKGKAAKVIREMFSCHDCRDTTSIWFPYEYQAIASGGMSWGDMPTDSSTTLYQFLGLPDILLEVGGVVVDFPHIVDLFLDKYGKQMTTKEKAMIKKFKIAEKV
jgi:hypothetical protein